MKLTRNLALTIVLAVAAPGWSFAAQASAFDLYAATPYNSWTNPSTLVTISPVTGEQTIVGGVGLTPHVYAMDYDPKTHSLYGVNPYSALLTSINLGSGLSSSVAIVRDASGTPVSMTALSFASDGTLYVGNRTLIGQVDRATNIYTPLLSLPAGQNLNGIDISPTGVMYAIYQNASSPAQTLVSIDTSDMRVMQQTALGSYTLGDIDYAPNGQLYASNFSYAPVRVDPASAVQTLVGMGAVGDLSGIASVPAVPEPKTYAMLLAGLSLVGLIARWRRG